MALEVLTLPTESTCCRAGITCIIWEGPDAASEFSCFMQSKWAFSILAFTLKHEPLREEIVSYSSLNPDAKQTAQNINMW